MFRTTYRQADNKLQLLKRPASNWRLAGQSVMWLLLVALFCGWGSESHPHGGGVREKMLKVFTRHEHDITRFFVQNLEAADVTGTFNLELRNLKASADFPYTTTFAGKQTKEVFALSPINQGAPWTYSYTDWFTVGNQSAVPDDSYIYTLPYQPGKVFRVSQGYHGSFSHTGPDEYAIDWQMPVGTQVCAARGGIVVGAKDDSDIGGPDREYEKDANYILIQHADGTLGIYAHLVEGGNRVKVGDRVATGEWIGRSGNTGFTSGPHLHFSVFKATDGRHRLSFPVKFKAANGPVLTLVSGQSYEATPGEVQSAKLKPQLASIGVRPKVPATGK